LLELDSKLKLNKRDGPHGETRKNISFTLQHMCEVRTFRCQWVTAIVSRW